MEDTPAKTLIVGIDIGTTNMGMCVLDTNHPEGVPYLEHSTLKRTKDGRVYANYEESLVDEMVYNWIDDRWNQFFSKAIIVIIEKQMTTMFSALDRGCLATELCMRMAFRVYSGMGGPLYSVKGPVWWKNAIGVEVGNNQLKAKKGYYLHGKYHPPQFNPSRGEHKTRADMRFKQLQCEGDPEVRSIQRAYATNLTTDMIEAYFIARATRENLEKAMEDAKVTTHHDVSQTTNGAIKSLRKKKRQIPLFPFGEKPLNTLPPPPLPPVEKKKRKTKEEVEGQPQKKKTRKKKNAEEVHEEE